MPFLPKRYVERTLGLSTSFDAGRGCPYQCSFCTIINVQGRKSRYRSADDVEHLVRLNWAQGIHKFFITDDNFARNREWEAIFDRLIELRERAGIPLGLMIQVDTLCHKIENFVVKAKRAGVTRVFIGLENINPDNLAAAKKRQNKITEYRAMLLAWKAQGIITFAGYILGFPADTPQTIRRDIEIIKRELPLDGLEFFCLTPLPGSEDHKVLWTKGVAMDPDLNKYDVEHVCTAHPKMSKAEWEAIYQEAWSLYYTPAHMKTLLRRAAATGVPMVSLAKVLVTFATTVASRESAPAPSRHLPPEDAVGTSTGPAQGGALGILAPLRLGHAEQARGHGRRDRTTVPDEACDRSRSERTKLHGPGAHGGGRRGRCDARSHDQDDRRVRCDRPRQEGRRAHRRRQGRRSRLPSREPCARGSLSRAE